MNSLGTELECHWHFSKNVADSLCRESDSGYSYPGSACYKLLLRLYDLFSLGGGVY